MKKSTKKQNKKVKNIFFAKKFLRQLDSLAIAAEIFQYKIEDVFTLRRGHILRSFTVDQLDEMMAVTNLIACWDWSYSESEDDSEILKNIKKAVREFYNLPLGCKDVFPLKIYEFLGSWLDCTTEENLAGRTIKEK